jgi:hypothetical protein
VNRASVIRAVVTAFGGVFAVAALAAVAAEIGQSESSSLASAQFFAWLVPLVAGSAAGILAWLVLDRPPVETVESDQTTTFCPTCGSPIMTGWRLCPHCGVFMGEESAGANGARVRGTASSTAGIAARGVPAGARLSANLSVDSATAAN